LAYVFVPRCGSRWDTSPLHQELLPLNVTARLSLVGAALRAASRMLGRDLVGAARRGHQFLFSLRRRTWGRSDAGGFRGCRSETCQTPRADVPRTHSEPRSEDPSPECLGSLRWTDQWWAAARLSGRGGE
jgi:hypothetical protein